MKMHLTDLAVKKLSLPKRGQTTYWDQSTSGFGVRCSTKSKSYVVMYGEKRRLKTLGRLPDLSLANARKQARVFLSMHITQGSEHREYQYEVVLSEYLEECRMRLRESTYTGYSLYLSHITFTGNISKITQGQVLKAITEYTQSKSSQNYAFTTFKVFFNWAVRRQLISANPLIALKRPHQSVTRQRVLDEDETKALLSYTLNTRDRFNDVVSLLLFTGQRKGEIATMEWSQVDGDLLTLPPEKTKNKREHIVPLGTHALDMLHSIEGGSHYVFGTTETDAPFNGWGRAQRRLLRETGIEHFTLHDLRRTFATIHAKIGTPIHVTEKLLNHVSGTISGVAAVYNRHSYMDEMRTAISQYDDYLENQINP